jgi:Zn-dependent protease
MRSYRVARVWGIPIEIDVSLVVFLPILAWLIGSGNHVRLYAGIIEGLTPAALDVDALQQGLTPWIVGSTAAIGLFVSVAVHELGHSWVARRYGLAIESITLWVFGGVASMPTVPREWPREFWIAVAGPAASVLVGVACYGLLQALPSSLPAALFVVGWLAVVNVALAGFNLLPIFPMDGGRVLRALLARTRPYAQATDIAARLGVASALLFAVVGVFSFNVVLVFFALFIYGAATAEVRTTTLEERFSGVTVGDVMTRDPPTIEATSTVADLVERMSLERQSTFAAVDDSGAIVGVVSLHDLAESRRRDRGPTSVADVMTVPTVTVPETADALETLAVLEREASPDALVLDGETTVGVLTPDDYAAALRSRRDRRVAGWPGSPAARK